MGLRGEVSRVLPIRKLWIFLLTTGGGVLTWMRESCH
jgi:hypothetical protein